MPDTGGQQYGVAPLVHLDIRPAVAPAAGHALSVIIPLGPAEASPEQLLSILPPDVEVVLARGGTRASSMNRGAQAASGTHVWFIHADTVLDKDAVAKLRARIGEGSGALWYFDIRFDGGFPMRLTELGVLFRSRLLGLPFGDQALCLPASAFRALGGYDEVTPYGEDHLLVWEARRMAIPVKPVKHAVATSARKYREYGWLRTTFTHLRLTLKQALPAWLGLMSRRRERGNAGPDVGARRR